MKPRLPRLIAWISAVGLLAIAVAASSIQSRELPWVRLSEHVLDVWRPQTLRFFIRTFHNKRNRLLPTGSCPKILTPVTLR